MSDSMNPYLAAMYNTNGAGEQMTEDMQKTATTELFCKLAADNGLDLSQMSDEQIAGVYAQVFPEEAAKLAEKEEGKEHEDKESKEHEGGEKEEEKEEAKKAAASEYLSEKNSFVEKCAEADHMGRIMAHAFTQERNAIEKQAADEVAPTQALRARRGGSSTVNTAAWEAGKKGKEESAHAARNAAAYEGPAQAGRGYSKGKQVGRVGAMGEQLKRFAGTRKGKAALIGAGVLTAGAAAAGIHHGLKKKEGSAEAFEELSADHAIKVAEAAGYNVEQAQDLVSAVYTLGLTESEKIAHVQDVDTAMHVRGLEYLEAAGYPVNWEEIFGS